MQFRLDQLAGLISNLGSAVLESRFIGWDHAKKIRGVNFVGVNCQHLLIYLVGNHHNHDGSQLPPGGRKRLSLIQMVLLTRLKAGFETTADCRTQLRRVTLV